MGRIITITNQKGGVGKTTTAINLSACLAEAGQHVMLVDFDPQGNASSGLGLEQEDFDKTVYDMLIEEAPVDECIIKEIQPNLDVLPSDMNLAGAEIEFQEVEGQPGLLDQRRRHHAHVHPVQGIGGIGFARILKRIIGP